MAHMAGMSARALLMAVMLGLFWGAIAVALSRDLPWAGRWSSALVLGPAVGLLIYAASRWAYGRSLWVLAGWSVASVYIGAGLYASSQSVVHQLETEPTIWARELLAAVALTWYALTCFPLLWLLHPLALASHILLARVHAGRPRPGSRGRDPNRA